MLCARFLEDEICSFEYALPSGILWCGSKFRCASFFWPSPTVRLPAQGELLTLGAHLVSNSVMQIVRSSSALMLAAAAWLLLHAGQQLLSLARRVGGERIG